MSIDFNAKAIYYNWAQLTQRHVGVVWQELSLDEQRAWEELTRLIKVTHRTILDDETTNAWDSGYEEGFAEGRAEGSDDCEECEMREAGESNATR